MNALLERPQTATGGSGNKPPVIRTQTGGIYDGRERDDYGTPYRNRR